MIGRALGDGFRSATRRPGLVALLWAWNLALALLVTAPFWRWISGASEVLPETDTLLDGADLGVISQLLQSDSNVLASLLAGVTGLLVVSLLSGAFLSGGILEVVMAEGDDRPLLHRFFRGAGAFVARFLRLLAIAAASAALAGGLAGAVLGAATRPLESSASEPASLWATVITGGGIGLVIAFMMLAHDYARVMTVVTGARGMVRTWLRALRFTARHALGAAAIGLLAAIGVLVAIGACAAFDVAFGARSWSLILGAILVQQAMVLFRTAVRVGQVSAQATYCRGLLPAGVPAATTVVEALEDPAERASVADAIMPDPPAVEKE